MKILKLLSSAVLISSLLSSCQDVIDLELNDTEILLVVEGEVNDVDSIQWVQLSYTTDYFDNIPPNYDAESGATIVMFENGIFLDTMTFNGNTKRFESKFTGAVGNGYRIEITTQNGRTYSSSIESIPENNPIDTIWVAEEENFGEVEQVIYIEAQEIPGVGNYYQWKAYVNNQYQSEPSDLVFVEDQFVDGNYIEEFDVFELDEEQVEFFTSASDSITVRIEQSGITQNHYEFLSDVIAQTAFAGGPFSPPPAEVRSNIESTDGGERALGIFTAVSISKASITFKP